MIEIIVLFLMCRSLGRIIRDKGRNPLGYQFLLVVLWYAGAFIGGFSGFLVGVIATGDEDSALLVGIGGGLLGAISAAVAVFQIAKALQPAFPDGYDRDDPYGPSSGDRDRLRRYDDYDRKSEGDGITNRPEDRPSRRLDDRIQE